MRVRIVVGKVSEGGMKPRVRMRVGEDGSGWSDDEGG
jgi:hypothetical protein